MTAPRTASLAAVLLLALGLGPPALSAQSVWDRPVTTLDYVIKGLGERFQERAEQLKASDDSTYWVGWASAPEANDSVHGVAMAGAKPGVVVGFYLQVDRLRASPRATCRWLMDSVTAPLVGLPRGADTPVLLRQLAINAVAPRTLVGRIGTRDLDALYGAMVYRIWLGEQASGARHICSRPALGDSVRIDTYTDHK